MHLETELKYFIDEKNILKLKSELRQIKKVSPPTLQNLKSIYYDDANLHIFQKGYVLRVREVDNKFIQTIKSRGESKEGLHVREEWNSEVASWLPDLTSIDDPNLLSTFSGLHLPPIFETVFQRTAWDIQIAEDCVIEMALDEGSINAGDGFDPICEVELELKKGDVKDLLAFAEDLMQKITLVPENRGKAERGYALLGGLNI